MFANKHSKSIVIIKRFFIHYCFNPMLILLIQNNLSPKMSEDEDKDLFLKQMIGVKPIKKQNKVQAVLVKPPIKVNKTEKSIQISYPRKFKAGITLNIIDDDSENMGSESILSYGLGRLSKTHKDQVVKGDIPIEARLDLHGMHRFEAQDRLHDFLNHVQAQNIRHLLIIHGKGSLHGETPILKQHIYRWLKQQPQILMMHSAHAKHGGTGALYVILKKHGSS